MAGKGDLFGEMWKEYAFSDSRYMTRDAFVVCMEATTAVSVRAIVRDRQLIQNESSSGDHCPIALLG